MAAALGQPFMPWQQHWALVVGEMIRDGETGIWVPAYPEAFVTVMRQEGKTLWVVAHELQRGALWEAYDRKPQAIAYSGQTGLMARQKFRKEHWPLIQHSAMRPAISRPRFDAGDTGLDFVNGSILTIWGSSEDAGHSLTVDLVSMDEIWADQDDRREQAALPAMATRHDSQKILASTGGTDKSVLYLRKQAAGRAAVTSGRTEGMAYLEFAFDPDDDPEDPRTWRQNMPALGYTITERTVQAALDEMRKEDGDLSEFKRAWGNVTKRTSGEQLIPQDAWVDVCSAEVLVEGRRVFAVSAAMDRSAASIAVADDEGRVAMVERRADVRWLLDRLTELWERWRAPIALDVGDPAGYLADKLEERRVEVRRYNAQTYAHACGALFDRIVDRAVSVFPDEDLDAAVKSASKRNLGEAWAWSRRNDDISPLVAVTLAADAASSLPKPTARVINLADV